jgi:hypothetical protein
MPTPRRIVRQAASCIEQTDPVPVQDAVRPWFADQLASNAAAPGERAICRRRLGVTKGNHTFPSAGRFVVRLCCTALGIRRWHSPVCIRSPAVSITAAVDGCRPLSHGPLRTSTRGERRRRTREANAGGERGNCKRSVCAGLPQSLAMSSGIRPQPWGMMPFAGKVIIPG